MKNRAPRIMIKTIIPPIAPPAIAPTPFFFVTRFWFWESDNDVVEDEHVDD